LVVHPNLWVREQAKEYLRMVLEENPPSHAYYLLCEIFEPPFPLEPKHLIDSLLLPTPLQEEEVDFADRVIKKTKKRGPTYDLFS
jgi:hypothetical protein